MSALRSAELFRLDVPFRERFAHASAERSRTESVLVRVETASGARGHGEGCPRAYVTGEDVASATAFFEAIAEPLLAEVADVGSLAAFAHHHARAIDASPAAWCALELAVLDALGVEAGLPLEALLGRTALVGPFRYTAVLGAGGSFGRLLARYREAGFGDFKLKLYGDRALDRERLGAFAPGEGVRVDANNLWKQAADAIAHVEAIAPEPTRLVGIEEPIGPGDLPGLARIARETGVPVILDESLLSAAPLEALPAPAEHWIANLRVSKLGGLLRSLEVARVARERGVRIVVGAQVGETSLLTRAALPVAEAAGPALLGQEGAFGTLLLERDPFPEPLAFGPGGVLPAPTPAPGLGLGTPDPVDWTPLARAWR